MSLITTVPAGRQFDIGVYSFGQMPNQNPSSVNLTIKHSGTVITGFYFGNDTTLQSLSMPNVVAIDVNNIQGGGFSTQGCTSMTSLSVPLLQKTGGDIVAVNSGVGTLSFPSLGTCGGDFAVGDPVHMLAFSAPVLTVIAELEFAAAGDCWSLPSVQQITGKSSQTIICSGNYFGTTISMPQLATAPATMAITFCPNLRNITYSSWLPTNGQSYFFTNDPQITSATTNLLLARGVAATGFVSGNLQISGTPTGQGVTDKATLQGRGVTVVTN